MRNILVKQIRTAMLTRTTATPDLIADSTNFSSVTYDVGRTCLLVRWGFDFFMLRVLMSHTAVSGGIGYISTLTNLSTGLVGLNLGYISGHGHLNNQYVSVGTFRQPVPFFYSSDTRQAFTICFDSTTAANQAVSNTSYAASTNRHSHGNYMGRNFV